MSSTPRVLSARLGFFATLAILSLLLNIVLAWQLYRPVIRETLATFKHPTPITADDHVRGSPEAAVTVIEYVDFQCPFCRRLHEELKILQSQLPFRWVYRHFPLDSHPDAARLAQASECAAQQGRFWEFVDYVFADRVQVVRVESLSSWVRAVELDSAPFAACMAADTVRASVQRQRAEGEALWIAGTPTIFVNGRRYVGALPIEELRRILEQAEH